MKTELALLLHYESPLISTAQLADILGITERTLENKIYKEESPVPMFKVGNKYVAHITDVASYIDAQRESARKAEAANEFRGRRAA